VVTRRCCALEMVQDVVSRRCCALEMVQDMLLCFGDGAGHGCCKMQHLVIWRMGLPEGAALW